MRKRSSDAPIWMGESEEPDHARTSVGYAPVTRDLMLDADAESRSDREKFRLLVDSIRDYAIYILDRDGCVVTWNRGAELIKGYTADEIVGKHISAFYTAEDRAAGRPEYLLARAVAEGRIEDEGWRVRKDGSRFWANVIITSIKDAAGTPQGFIKVTRDLTDRRRAEEHLRRSEEHFRLIVESARDYAIITLDPNGLISSWNAGAERIKGYAATEVLGRHFSMFYTPEDVEAGKCALELDVATRVGRMEDEGWRVRRDGSKFWANVVITPLRDAQDTLIGFAKITRDLTDKRRLEEERIALARAQEAIRLRDEFLSIASHELKTPLTALQLQLHALSSRLRNDGESARRVSKALRSGERLADFIETLLDVARISTGHLTLSCGQLDIVYAIAQVIDDLRDAAVEAGCELRLHAEGPVIGHWDALRMTQVLINLVSNGIKYGRGGPVDVAVFPKSEDVLIEVTDSGPGIAEQDLSRIFDRFERAVPMRHYGGLGLGLYIAREIVRAHGGSIEAKNIAGRGARFSVRLPLAPVVS